MKAGSAIGYTDVTTIDQPRDVRLLMRNVNGKSYVAFQNPLTMQWLEPIPCSHTPEAIEAKRRIALLAVGAWIESDSQDKGEQRLRDMIEAGAADITHNVNIEVSGVVNTDRLQLEEFGRAVARHSVRGDSVDGCEVAFLKRDYSYLLAEHKTALAELDNKEKALNEFRFTLDNRDSEIRALKRKVGSLSQEAPESEIIKRLRLELSEANEKAGQLRHENHNYHYQANEACTREQEATQELKHVRHQMRLLLKAVYGASAVMAVAAFLHFAFGV